MISWTTYIHHYLSVGTVACDTAWLCTFLPAAQRGYVEVARVLIENSADVNFQSTSGKTPLMMASFSGIDTFLGRRFCLNSSCVVFIVLCLCSSVVE